MSDFKEMIDSLSDEKVIDLLDYPSSARELLIDDDYVTAQRIFESAKKAMEVAESKMETRAFHIRDRVLMIIEKVESGEIEGDQDYLDDRLRDFMYDASKMMLSDSGYVYLDSYGSYGHGDVGHFWIPSTC